MKIPIFTCVCSFPPVEFTSVSQRNYICKEEVDGEAEGAKAAETGEEQGEGRGGRQQVDYGRRSRCLETAGTRDARLLGDRHDAMTSAV